MVGATLRMLYLNFAVAAFSASGDPVIEVTPLFLTEVPELSVRGRIGAFAGSRMVGGTIWTELGFGADPGLLLRRGSLIGPTVDKMLPTFADSGKHDLVILRVLSRYLTATLGPARGAPGFWLAAIASIWLVGGMMAIYLNSTSKKQCMR